VNAEQKNIAVWALVIAGAAYAIVKLKGSLGFGNSFNPNDITGLATVWNDSPQKHAAYTYTMHADKASNLSEDIYSNLGAFSDNFTNIFADIQQCKTKGDVYQVCQLFRNNYDAGLWESLINGYGLFPWSGLSSDQLKILNDYVLSLKN
jgi:hypothetical protein